MAGSSAATAAKPAATAPAPAPATTSSSSPTTNYLLLLAKATIAGLWIGTQFVLVPYVVHLMLLVTAILYVACHQSLVLREEPKPEEQPDGTFEKGAPQGEVLRKEDAYQFPILGSISLFSLYLAFKFLDKSLVNLLIGLYFCIVGCIALFATISPMVPALGPSWKMDKKINHPLPEFLMESPLVIQFDVTASEMLVFLGAAVFCGFYYYFKHWTMNNILGICFCLQGIERFSLGTYKIGAILLVGLFFYDIFWV